MNIKPATRNLKLETIVIILFAGLMLFGFATDSVAQEKKGKLGDFEDANKGKKSSNDNDDDDDGGWLSFFFDIGIDILLSDSDDDEEVEDGANSLAADKISFGAFPFDPSGIAQSDYEGKNFLGRISGGYQEIDSKTHGLRLNGQFQFSGKHGMTLDFIYYTESLPTHTDHLQVIGLAYRHLFHADNNLLFAGNAGLKVLNPDKFKDADFGLEMAIDAQWFIANPISINGKIGFAPIVDQLDAPEPPFLFDFEIGAGLHMNNFELFAAYKTMVPSVDPGSALHGQELGLRIWF
ncbi:MAG: hypothetical protein D8M58_00270 [Calditrichaeota bacterium]|nr:MAG: hypothetical protein DWQ03_06810 [Calditrichota bacterium]MBL1203804.1 hypothetical protein [Calditrichota bacterium]NOG43634.1 hypothetical protein [Calditrichota bacterium]